MYTRVGLERGDAVPEMGNWRVVAAVLLCLRLGLRRSPVIIVFGLQRKCGQRRSSVFLALPIPRAREVGFLRCSRWAWKTGPEAEKFLLYLSSKPPGRLEGNIIESDMGDVVKLQGTRTFHKLGSLEILTTLNI